MPARTPAPALTPTSAPTLGRFLQVLIAAASIGAGLVHISAARDHWSQGGQAMLFILAAAGQVAWGLFVLRRHSRPLLLAGAAGQLLLATFWVLSRTRGLEVLGGGVEPLGWKDGIAALLELAAVAGAFLAVALPDLGRVVALPTGRLAQRTALSSVAALTFTAGVLAPGHSGGQDGAGHAHGDAVAAHEETAAGVGDGHSHTELAAGQVGEHRATGALGSASASAGHPHGGGAGADHGPAAAGPSLGLVATARGEDHLGMGHSVEGHSAAASNAERGGHELASGPASGRHPSGTGVPQAGAGHQHDGAPAASSPPPQGSPAPSGHAHESAGEASSPESHAHEPAAADGSSAPSQHQDRAPSGGEPEQHKHAPGEPQQGSPEASDGDGHDHADDEDESFELPGVPEGILPARELLAVLRPAAAVRRR